MGVYWLVANLDSQEYLNPHRLGDGAKDREVQYSSGGTLTALAKLLADKNWDGWYGDRIVFVPDSDPFYNTICERWQEVSQKCRERIESDGIVRFERDGDCGDDYVCYNRHPAHKYCAPKDGSFVAGRRCLECDTREQTK